MAKKTTKKSSSKKSAPKVDAYERITNAMIALLEAGTVPWRKPWRGGAANAPKSLATGRNYRGINVFILHCAAMARGYRSPLWCTFNQAKKRGGSVMKGEKGTQVVLWRWIEKEDEKTGEKKRIPFLRVFTVFNLEQTEGVDVDAQVEPTEELDFVPVDAAEAIVEGMPSRPRIETGSRAAYSPTLDYVEMPAREDFVSVEEWYSTLFHELGHATGHESRLNRPEVAEGVSPFGSKDYSREELVAEMTAAFLCGEAGIDAPVIENSAAYVAGWLKKLKEDKKAVVIAAQRAQKAADYILDRKVEKDSTDEEKAQRAA